MGLRSALNLGTMRPPRSPPPRRPEKNDGRRADGRQNDCSPRSSGAKPTVTDSHKKQGSPRRLLFGALVLLALPSTVVFVGTRLYAPWQPLDRGTRSLNLPAELRERVERVRQTGAFELPPIALNLAPSAGEDGVPSSEQDHALLPLSPVSTQVRADRPTFRWTERSTPRGGEIQLTVRSVDGEVRARIPTAGSSVQPDEPLPRGEVLTWQLVSETGPESEQVVFRILAPDEVPEMTNRLAELPDDRALGTDLLLARALVLLDYGLLEEARLELLKARQLPVELQVSLRSSLELADREP